MTSTALRAENSNSRTITFKSKEHEKFYMEYLEKCRYQDVYHQALVYCLQILLERYAYSEISGTFILI